MSMKQSIPIVFGGMKNSTAKIVLWLSISGGVATRQDMLGKCKLSLPTVTAAIEELARLGMIVPTENYEEYSLTKTGAFFCNLSNHDEFPDEPAEDLETDGFVYFALAGDMVKIGFAQDPRARLEELQTGNPNKIKLLATIPANRKYETEIQHKFDDDHIRGEWYRYSTSIKVFLADPNTIKSFFATTAVKFKREGQKELITKAEVEEKKLFLKRAGVGEPMRTRLAEKHNREYLENHIRQWRSERKPVSLLIHRLKNDDPAPKQQNQDYTGGEFADFIEH